MSPNNFNYVGNLWLILICIFSICSLCDIYVLYWVRVSFYNIILLIARWSSGDQGYTYLLLDAFCSILIILDVVILSIVFNFLSFYLLSCCFQLQHRYFVIYFQYNIEVNSFVIFLYISRCFMGVWNTMCDKRENVLNFFYFLVIILWLYR